jgi:hypothetical protein
MQEDRKMNQTLQEKHSASGLSDQRLPFFEQLQALAAKLPPDGAIEAAMSEMSQRVCDLFGCDRWTLYTASAGKTSLESKIKTGMDKFKQFSLPISGSSLAGYAALMKRPLNITDVYDQDELQTYSSELRFLDKVDKRTGYRTREMILAPVLSANTGELFGLLQLMNNKAGGPFPALIEEGVQEFCKRLALLYENRVKTPVAIHGRFDPLVMHGLLSTPELEQAKRSARRKGMELEDVLIDEFQVQLEAIGAAYAHFFSVPYEPFREGRAKPTLLHKVKREYARHNGWLILDSTGNRLTVVALDPESLKAMRTVEDVLPGYEVQVCVTTAREFAQTLEQIYAADPHGPADPDAALERIHRIVAEALAAHAPDLQAVLRPELGRILGSGVNAESGATQLAIRIDIRAGSAGA